MAVKKISFVIPVHNEVANVPELYKELNTVLAPGAYEYEFLFVDDGSNDGSLDQIKSIAAADPRVYYIELSRNFGHQYALKAGLDVANGDCVISMDSDLQHPPEVIIELIKKWEEGYDVVYTRRKENGNSSWIKRKMSQGFYSVLNKLSDLGLENGTADFRLMSRNIVDAFSHLNENELFIRGLVKWAGFRQASLFYEPRVRYSGKSKYSFKKMLSFAVRGITSFSVLPLKIIAYIGLVQFIGAMILAAFTLISYFFGYTFDGWVSLMLAIILFGSLQVLMLGIIGVYLSKVALQSRQRPLYFIRETNYSNPAKDTGKNDLRR